jgi:hypothetical protein
MTPPTKIYKSPGAIRQAFDRKYRDDPARALVIVMQRFAARVCQEIESAVVKGGLGLELRLDTPRTTEDADIIIAGSHDLEARLEAAGQIDLGEFLKFRVRQDSGAEFVVPGMPYPGKRYIIQALFADGSPPWPGNVYRKFTLEVSVRTPAGHDLIHSELEGFPQARSAPIRVYSLHWQIAEKVHAYTDPRHRDTANHDLMRPRDLLDLCRCAVAATPHAKVESSALRSALQHTFATRKAKADVELQDLPIRLPTMPDAWVRAFDQHIRQAALPWATPAIAHAVAGKFLNPILDDSALGAWDPATQLWVAAQPQSTISTS